MWRSQLSQTDNRLRGENFEIINVYDWPNFPFKIRTLFLRSNV